MPSHHGAEGAEAIAAAAVAQGLKIVILGMVSFFSLERLPVHFKKIGT